MENGSKKITSIGLIFVRWDWVQNYSWTALVIGIGILLTTGTLYKKLT
jgi:hypothetical protein